MRSGHEVVLDDAAQEVTVRRATGAVVRLTPTSVEVQANATVKVTSPMVRVDAAVSTFRGLVKVGTLIAERAVMSPSHTPGAGNVC